eukprot:scaffold140181_cov30-Tisochrysis_lutea.AAC.1
MGESGARGRGGFSTPPMESGEKPAPFALALRAKRGGLATRGRGERGARGSEREREWEWLKSTR